MSEASGRRVKRYKTDQMFILITVKVMNLASTDMTTAVILDLRSNYR